MIKNSKWIDVIFLVIDGIRSNYELFLIAIDSMTSLNPETGVAVTLEDCVFYPICTLKGQSISGHHDSLPVVGLNVIGPYDLPSSSVQSQFIPKLPMRS